MRRAADRRRNPQAETASRPGMSDAGQRYRVTYRDGMGTRCTFGFTNNVAEAHGWVKRIQANPVWSKAMVTDREEVKT